MFPKEVYRTHCELPIGPCICLIDRPLFVQQSILPSAPFGNPLDQIYQTHQYWHFDQRSHGRSERLVAVGSVSCNGDSNGEFEVVACCRKALSSRKLIAKTKAVCYQEGDEKDSDEVHNQGCGDAYY